jgi:xanthine dehydrogenase iron-sulfur cluster and FAD-binding subunit A
MRRHIQFLRRSAVIRLSGAAPYLTILDYLRDLDKVLPFAMAERAVAAQLLIWRGAIAVAASPSERVAIASTGAAHA